MGMNDQITRIEYYSDVLCIWAYIAQTRMDELRSEFGTQVSLQWRYLSVFGDVPTKLENSWGDRGFNRGYAQHVHTVAEQFPEIEIHPDLWKDVVPVSSGPAHLWLCAARLVSTDTERRYAAAIRKAFFCDLVDISQESELYRLAQDIGLDGLELRQSIQSGHAWTALCSDWNRAKNESVQVSPTIVFNDGRQRLSGNVGYRIIKANLKELMNQADEQYSWC